MEPQAPVRKRIVLVGGGHAHVTVLRAFAMRPEPGVGLTVIAKELDAPYSGMLPGYVAGHYTLDECHIDVVRLAQRAGARLIHGTACGIDREARRVLLDGRPPLAYDLLSIDTGITPLLDGIAGAAENAIAVKPVSTFAPRWEDLRVRALAADGPRRIAIVGTGAAGFELILAIRHRLRAEAPAHGLDPESFAFTLVGSGVLLPTHNARARRYARAALADARVTLVENDAAVRIAPDALHLASGRTVPSDATLLTTKAAPPAWFAATGLTRDAAGFLALRPTLQTMDDADIFAAGDCATVIEHVREKAGVFAVRQGPPLTDNLRRRARGEAALPFKPQRQFLTLLALGDKAAIASRGPFAARGRWAWTWKDRIDRPFMERFAELPAMGPAHGTAADEMPCRGCGAKLGPNPLAAALDRIASAPGGLTVQDLSPRDDAAVLDLGGGPLRLETIDHFPAPWPEPYVAGEIAAQNAISDILVKGGTPDHALVMAQVPRAAPHLQEDDLFQLLAGARAVLDAHGIALVGGHTTQGDELAAGLFVSGTVAREHLLPKRGLVAGDVLVLTKPLGTGVVLAAAMRGMARAREVAAILAGMRLSNAAAAGILAAHGARAMTDVTGFGLVGHLAEMLAGSDLAAHLDATACPLYPGALALARDGVHSTLLTENMAHLGALLPGSAGAAITQALLLDPQTSGGVLAGVPADRVAACLAALHAAGVTAAARIGEIGPAAGAEAGRIALTTTLD
ncbi:MAG: selenide, water dikinase SelD [Hyphomicrobiaceae bacterium]